MSTKIIFTLFKVMHFEKTDNQMKAGILQKRICSIINSIGGKVTYKKEYGPLARLGYRISGKEPVIAIEALLLGERFGVIINRPTGYRHILNKSAYRIVRCDNVDEFNNWFEEFKLKKLAQ